VSVSDKTQTLLKHPQALCNMVRRIAIKAGDHTLQYYDESGSMAFEHKENGSVVTIADREAEDIILAGLRDIAPDIPMIGEESIEAGHRPDISQAEYFWLVDPLDGTRGFVRGSPDYTVNIALIHRDQPVIGVIYAPVPGELYAGFGTGTAIRWMAESESEKPIRVRDMPHKGITVMESSHHRAAEIEDRFLMDLKVEKRVRRGSSIKICMIAAGKADLYPRLGETSEWDTAAGDAILRAAGGKIVDLKGVALTYGHAERDFNNPEFIASSGFWPIMDEE